MDGKADQYVTNTGSTSSLGLTASTTYRTTDGKYVTTDGSGEITNVTSDITITDITTTYLAVTLPDNGSASGLQYTIAGNDKTQYVANGGTLTVSITLNGTANAATPIKVETDTATVTATANPLSHRPVATRTAFYRCYRQRQADHHPRERKYCVWSDLQCDLHRDCWRRSEGDKHLIFWISKS